MTTSHILNIDQSPSELVEVYDADYYWYLQSPEIHEAFLCPLGKMADIYCGPVLDVGCGEGWLSEHITSEYVGVDGSMVAIERAMRRYPRRKFLVGRLENPDRSWCESPDVVVFGGLLSVLIKEQYRVEFLQMYIDTFRPLAVIVYDLETLDTTDLDAEFDLVEELHGTAEVQGLQEVKKHRQIRVYRCQ